MPLCDSRGVTVVALVGLLLASACHREPASAKATVATGLRSGTEIEWPVPIGAPSTFERACNEGYCLPGDALGLVFTRAARWMAHFAGTLQFDAAIDLSQIRRIIENEDLTHAFDAARLVADADVGEPLRRFWLPDMRLPAGGTAQWNIPADGSRARASRVIREALHCAENGWRASTTAYACGPMRDGGGYETTQALWAITIARANGCVGDAAAECVSELERELVEAQPLKLDAPKTPELDLYARRLLVLLLSGYDQREMNTWARTLIAQQNTDGSWGAIGNEGRYQATSASTWALAEWYRYLATHRGEVPVLGAIRLKPPAMAIGPAFWGCALPVR